MGIHNLAQLINKQSEIVIEPEAPAPDDERHIERGRE